MGGILCGKRWKHASVYVWSLSVPQHIYASCLGKPHLQTGRRRHLRPLSSLHKSEWLLLLFGFCCIIVWSPLSFKSWRKSSEDDDRPKPHFFCRDGCEQLLRAGKDLAIQPCCTPGLPWGHTLILSWAEWVLPQPNPDTLVTLWHYNNMKVLKKKVIYQSHLLTMCP